MKYNHWMRAENRSSHTHDKEGDEAINDETDDDARAWHRANNDRTTGRDNVANSLWRIIDDGGGNDESRPNSSSSPYENTIKWYPFTVRLTHDVTEKISQLIWGSSIPANIEGVMASTLAERSRHNWVGSTMDVGIDDDEEEEEDGGPVVTTGVDGGTGEVANDKDGGDVAYNKIGNWPMMDPTFTKPLPPLQSSIASTLSDRSWPCNTIATNIASSPRRKMASPDAQRTKVKKRDNIANSDAW
jgi:hypothetical protein